MRIRAIVDDGFLSTATALVGALRSNSKKIAGIFGVGVAIGLLDGVNVLYAHIGNSGIISIVAYQAGFIAASGAAAYFCLSERGWSRARKLSTMCAAPFIATIGDNTSIDVQLKIPYLLWVPKVGWEWRNQDFSNTALAPLAQLTDGRTFGILDGYLLSIAILGAYLGMQYWWGRRT